MEDVSSSPTNTLVELLKNFNRKERYWVIQNALGEQEQFLPLSAEFRKALGETIQKTIPEDAWWGMDYHINWLFAIAFLLEDLTCSEGSNLHFDENGQLLGHLIEGNQEDVDLIVAFGNTMVVLEAKCTGTWTSKQNDSKAERLKWLREKLPETIELFMVYWAPNQRNDSTKLSNDSLKMHLWLAPQDRMFWHINRDSAEGLRWKITPTKR